MADTATHVDMAAAMQEGFEKKMADEAGGTATTQPKKEEEANPFRPAETVEKRPKILLWGDSGSGKTTLALQFPQPVVIDLERGTEAYGKSSKFDVVHTQDADRVRSLVQWLRTHKHQYRTFVLDPITVYWEALQRKWSEIFMRRNKSSKGFRFEYYDFQPRDWMQLRDEYQALLRSILSLDMNIIITAHSKPEYADGEFMKKIGQTFDSQKKTPYLFDVVLELTHNAEANKYHSVVTKDRTRSLPSGSFPTSYDVFRKSFGNDLDREATPWTPATEAQQAEVRRLCGVFKLSDEQIRSRLESYGAQSVEELSSENADIIIGKLEKALSAKGKS